MLYSIQYSLILEVTSGSAESFRCVNPTSCGLPQRALESSEVMRWCWTWRRVKRETASTPSRWISKRKTWTAEA